MHVLCTEIALEYISAGDLDVFYNDAHDTGLIRNDVGACGIADMHMSHDTCLREFPTRPDTNRPAQPQKLARVLNFRL